MKQQVTFKWLHNHLLAMLLVYSKFINLTVFALIRVDLIVLIVLIDLNSECLC